VSKKPIIGGIILAAIVGVVFVGTQINPDNPENEESPNCPEPNMIGDIYLSCGDVSQSPMVMKEIWRARMVGTEVSYSPPHESQSFPSSYVDDRTTMQVDTYRTLTLESNVPYQFRFVATGDSPEQIVITVDNRSIFYEIFHKEGTLVDTGISQYYTWDYVGNKTFEISDEICSSSCGFEIKVERNVWYNDGGTVTILLYPSR